VGDVAIREAGEGDLRAVAAIYNEQVTGGIATFDTEPKSEADFAARLARANPADQFLVAVDVDSVVGFAYSGDFRSRPAYAGTRETTVYVAEGARGRGVARALYTELLARLDAAGAHTQMAVIALPNEASEALHRSLGFERVGVLREVGHKFGRYIDTAWWQRVG
jgi:L-amino acid N-acyltransferase YncA